MQNHIERILAGWVRELSVPMHYGHEVTGFTQDDTGVDVALSYGKSFRVISHRVRRRRGLIRETAGIEFPGWDPTMSNVIAEVELAEEPSEWESAPMHAASMITRRSARMTLVANC